MPSTAGSRNLRDKVAFYLKARRIAPGSSILAAFSGGPDSSALVHALKSLELEFPLGLACAYLDHGIRPAEEIGEEIKRVSALCERLGLVLHQGRLEPGLLAAEAARGRRSLEERAREARYHFLEECARRAGCRYIATGHTEDDQLETLIMRFFQGSGLAGLAGIPELRGRILRPLMACSREEVLAYCREEGLSPSLDSTNLDPRYLRNRVRRQLLPVLREIFPGFRNSLGALARDFRENRRLLEREAGRRLPWQGEPPPQGGFSIPAARFFSASPLLRLFSLLPMLNRLRAELRRIPRRFLAPLLVQSSHTPKQAGTLLRGCGVLFRLREGLLEAVRDIVPPNKKGYLIHVRADRTISVGPGGIVFQFRPGMGAMRIPTGEGPVLVRSRRPGDRIRLDAGSRSVKKIFVEWKIPAGERWKVPVVADRQGLAAVLGEPFGYRNLLRSGQIPESCKPIDIRVEVEHMEDK